MTASSIFATDIYRETPMSKNFAIYHDLSGVTELSDGSGAFERKTQALERLVQMLEGRRNDVREKLASARGALRYSKRT